MSEVISFPAGGYRYIKAVFQYSVSPPNMISKSASNGLAWHFAKPPIVGLDFEMDVRGATRELVLAN